MQLRILRTFHLFIICTALGHSSAFAGPRPPACEDTTLIKKNLAFCANAMDPIRSTRWRPTMPFPAYRTRIGLQIHPRCFEIAALAKPPIPREQAIQNLENWTEAAFLSVADSCQVRFPQLSSIFGEWIAQVRRAVVTCS